MGRPKKLSPRYLEHKASGRGRAVFWDAAGNYQDILLPGAFESKESREAFGRVLLESAVAPAGANVKDRDGLTLVEVLAAYLDHATKHYRHPDGSPTSELVEVKLVLKSLRELYADLPAADFSALKLKAVRQGWIGAKLSRGEVNRRTGIVKRIFKWAASEELVPASVFHSLTVVSGLQKGRTTAPETEAVTPVADAVVDATLPYLSRHVRGLIEFMRLTGCRPGEACIIRRSDIDTGGNIWLYTPEKHKNQHRGKARVIAIGPKAQKVLREFFTPDLSAYLFRPSDAVEEQRKERAAARQTPKHKAHMKRNAAKRVKNPRRVAGDHYTASSLGHAIDRACDRAFPPPGELAQREGETAKAWKVRLTPMQRDELKTWQAEHRWHANQLRHTFATRVRKEHGLEAAQVLLGHSKADVTQIYAEKNEALATAIAEKMG